VTKNAYTVDATTIGGDGVIVPKDLVDEPEAYRLVNVPFWSAWAIKVVNKADAEVDVQALTTTSDDAREFTEYRTDGTPETVPTGTPPTNVVQVEGTAIAQAFAAELTASTTPSSGEIKVVFNRRLYGGR